MLEDPELIRLIEGGESDRVEFTRAVNDMDKLRKAICAFANDLPNYEKPGVIFVGLDDHGNCANLQIDDLLLQKLGGLRADGNILPLPVMSVDRRHLRNCEVAIIQVEPSKNPPVRVRGRCWIRPGPLRAWATPEEERRLTEKRRWGDLSYDTHGVSGATVESDINTKQFKEEYLPSAIAGDVLQENRRDQIEQLKALRLVAQNGTPTVAAILMLGIDPIRWFPGTYIQFVRYSGNAITDSIIDHEEFNGTLPNQLREIERRLKLDIATALDTSGERHIERPDYPIEALRELIRNAVIHRNYENSNTPVRITWLANRMEISNPGSVFGSVPRENFGATNDTAYRNPTIAEVMKNLGFMQRFGIGIPTAREKLIENGNPEPEFEVTDTHISVTVRRRP